MVRAGRRVGNPRLATKGARVTVRVIVARLVRQGRGLVGTRSAAGEHGAGVLDHRGDLLLAELARPTPACRRGHW